MPHKYRKNLLVVPLIFAASLTACAGENPDVRDGDTLFAERIAGVRERAAEGLTFEDFKRSSMETCDRFDAGEPNISFKSSPGQERELNAMKEIIRAGVETYCPVHIAKLDFGS